MKKKLTAKQARAAKKMSPKRRAAFKKMLARAPSIADLRRRQGKKKSAPGRKRRSASASKSGKAFRKAFFGSSQWSKLTKKQKRQAKGFERFLHGLPGSFSEMRKRARKAHSKRKRQYRRNEASPGFSPLLEGVLAKSSRTAKKESFVSAQVVRGRTRKQAEAAWRLAHRRPKKKGGRRRVAKSTWGKFKTLRARIGRVSLQTFLYPKKGKRGKKRLAHLPEYAVLGYASRADMRRRTGTDKGRAAYEKKKSALERRRERLAEQAARRIRAGRGMFSPNPGATISYEEWKEMQSNGRRGRRKGRKGQSRKQRLASLRNLRKARAALRRRGGGGRKRKVTRKAGRRRSGAGRKRMGQRRWMAKMTRRHGRKRAKAIRRMLSRRHGRRFRPNNGAGLSPNRRRRHGRRRFRRNGTDLWIGQLKRAFGAGAIIVIGFGGHRALSKLFDEHALSKVGFLQSEKIAPYRPLISAGLVALPGVILAYKFAPKYAAVATAGIAGSFILNLLQAGLVAAKQDKVAGYLSGFGEYTYAPGLGEFYATQNCGGRPCAPGSCPPGSWGGGGGGYRPALPPPATYVPPPPMEVRPDMPRPIVPVTPDGGGTYARRPARPDYARPVRPGMARLPAPGGAAPQIRGFGDWTPAQAACAGMGADGPYQAGCGVYDAGVGEYVAMGPMSALGGGYEMSGCGPTPLMSMDEGIAPNLASAEQALSIAEAMSGDLPSIPTITPTDQFVPVGTDYAGDRQAVFAGSDGIFGGCAAY